MTPPALYIIGGVAVGKSTFMNQLTSGMQFGTERDVHRWHSPYQGRDVRLVGHDVRQGGLQGIYLGRHGHPTFPGTDRLERTSHNAGKAWLEGLQPDTEPDFIIGEGATLATKAFMETLVATTDALVMHLHCDPMVADLRLLGRGTGQPESFVKATVTRSLNTEKFLATLGHSTYRVDTEDPDAWRKALADGWAHLGLA